MTLSDHFVTLTHSSVSPTKRFGKQAMESKHQQLTSAYRQTLSDLPLHWLDRSREHEADFKHLSGLFLPGTSLHYEQAMKRIMVIGRETRRWDIVTAREPFIDLDDYIQRAMAIQQEHLAKYSSGKADRGASFFNFVREIRQGDNTLGVAWANLFSFAWQRGSPMRWEHFKELVKVSKRLLEVQIDILRPDIIVFANGASSAHIRQQFFPHKGELSVCSELGDYREHGISLNQLWRFRLHDAIQCYRIQHPSSVSAKSRAARRFLLEQILLCKRSTIEL
ncbi:hypothetical protein QSV36_15350 [Pseudomonas sp. BCRC 81390]|uniref:hypothetical protein n=1 Tax=Pseudomonas sp. BCRC 81390 TaxID=3054778 RepID=UPI002595699F|nr:hypothetical protein [Pseudomonas sp. BCRC 81390]MDM3886953.1 hypothetical protein [Pseudomonas sp. BCRC 81390]